MTQQLVPFDEAADDVALGERGKSRKRTIWAMRPTQAIISQDGNSSLKSLAVDPNHQWRR